MQAFEIPVVNFTKDDYNKDTNEIFINLNNHRELDNQLNEYKRMHRRTIPQINVVSPTGNMVNFCYPVADKWEIVYTGKSCKIRLGFA
jgi:hypothetical protein